MTKATGI